MSVLQRFRSAISGRFITGAEAAASPTTSVAERDGRIASAARALLAAYDADPQDTQLAPQFEALRKALD